MVLQPKIRRSRAQSRYDLDKIIACDRTLAFEILKAMTAQGEYSMCMWDLDPLMPLLNALHSDERLALLDACAQLRMTELPRILVGDDTVLYRRFLGRPEMRRHHLTPLIGSPTAPGWIDKALVALEFGYTPMDVALAARGCHWGGWGPMSRMWQRWINEFAPLLGHSDSRVQAIGKAGTEWSTAARDEAVRREKYEAVHGHIDE
jgi:hypothetical protein